MSLLADMIRRRLGTDPGTNEAHALLAAVDACEELRDRDPDMADRILMSMARTLNAGVPWERIDEFRELTARFDCTSN